MMFLRKESWSHVEDQRKIINGQGYDRFQITTNPIFRTRNDGFSNTQVFPLYYIWNSRYSVIFRQTLSVSPYHQIEGLRSRPDDYTCRIETVHDRTLESVHRFRYMKSKNQTFYSVLSHGKESQQYSYLTNFVCHLRHTHKLRQ